MAPAPPASPPKRVTRARAAATKSTASSKDQETSTIRKTATRARKAPEEKPVGGMPQMDEPLRKSARRVGTAGGARRIKITPLDATTTEADTQAGPVRTAVPTKPRVTRTKKTVVEEGDQAEEANKQPAPAKRQPASTKATEPNQEAIPKVRGRPKKAEMVAESKPVTVPARQTRARAGSGAANTRSLTAAPKATAPKKKVTFQEPEDGDKENRPLSRSSTVSKTKTAPTTGLKAKPVRRPATAAPKTKATPATKSMQRGKGELPKRILTPKKVTQVAKSSSPVGLDEDELNGEKTPLRNLTQSPRRNAVGGRVESPVKKLDFGVTVLAGSPVDRPIMGLQSPARRQGLTPFKDALKDSPKRVESVFKLSPTKPAATVVTSNQQILSASTLGMSPKRGVYGPGLFPTSPSKVIKSPYKMSLMKSPPKRLFSPSKARSPEKTRRATPTKADENDVLSPDVAVSSHFRASQSPQRSVRVHKMRMDELQEEMNPAIDFDQSIIDIRSPLRADKQATVFDIQEEDSDELLMGPASLTVPESNLSADVEAAVAEPLEDDLSEPATPSKVVKDENVAVNPASLLFRSGPMAEDDDSSEDELQSPVRAFNMQTPSTAMAKRSYALSATSSLMSQKSGFTPLAAQLSGWLAASPNKAAKRQPHGLFSPAAAQHVPGEVILDRRSPALSRVSTDRLSMEARQSLGQRISLTPRRSSTAAAFEGSEEPSAFADEMAVKDLEREIDEMDESSCETAMTFSHEMEGLQNDTVMTEIEEPVQRGTEMIEDGLFAGVSASSRRSSIFRDLTRASSGDGDVTVTLPDQVQVDRELQAEEMMIDPEEPESPVQTGLAAPSHGHETLETLQSEIVLEPSRSLVLASAPAVTFNTPLQQGVKQRYAHTVSKVPLREEGLVSPIKVTKKRSRSLSTGPSPSKRTPNMKSSALSASKSMPSIVSAEKDAETPCSTMTTPGQQSFMVDDFGDSTLDGIEIDEDDENLPPVTPTRNHNAQSVATTPSEIPKASQSTLSAPGILQGAVVFVDVHTTEGADASGIFIELLSQMGAKCVKSWSWNPRASLGVKTDDGQTTSVSKIGITHVVYKDGGKRTLEKVRDTDGVVKCVGVGWVLDCERLGRWMDEANYAVDPSIFPRGGSRRRKSMQPRALLNTNGSLSVSASVPHSRRSFSAELSREMRDELVNTPVRGRVVTQPEMSGPAVNDKTEEKHDEEEEEEEEADESSLAPATPTGFVAYDPADPAFQTPAAPMAHAGPASTTLSPTTPFYLDQGHKLIQMTCPPKQTGKGLFDADEDDHQDERESEGQGGSGSGPWLAAAPTQSFRVRRMRGADGALGKRMADARRRTLGVQGGWKPVVRSPLGRE